ncbi:MAG: hypothetical protein EPN26_05010 [Rhodospirillales bacterium]|nr:MAG: hypothetical protein EPN26_05010 [Rhodospirillales bacterium]
MRKLAAIIGLSGFALLLAGNAHAVNWDCQIHRLKLSPMMQVLIERLRWHMWTRDNDLKITAEADLDAFIALTQITDRYGKLITNAIRDYNDGDPEADHLCFKYVLEADCMSYLVYQNTVINLPKSDRKAIEDEGVRRCERARDF